MLADLPTPTFDGPFADELRAFAAADLAAPPPPGVILFYGSSSIRLWSSLAADFAGWSVLNRGFGGSTIGDCVYHFFSFVAPYEPSRIVFYAGDNDLDQGATPEQVRDRFAELLDRIRKHCGAVPVAFLAIKQSPARWGNATKIRRANALVAEYIASRNQDETTLFLDVSTPMLRPDNLPDLTCYDPDQLHLSARGYALWRQLLIDSGFLPSPAAPPFPWRKRNAGALGGSAREIY